MPRAGEREALARRTAGESSSRAAESRQRQAELAARQERSRALIETLSASPRSRPDGGEAIWQAAELRVREGKDSPAEALSLRRALIAAQLTAIDLELRRLAAQAELAYLSQETRP